MSSILYERTMAHGHVVRIRRLTPDGAVPVRAVIEVVPPQTFPRTDFKARRVIDDREVFRELARKLQGT